MDRFKLIGDAEHGEYKLLIYNQHQPASKERQFKPNQRLNFCKAILEDAVHQQKTDASIIGFGFGGDANCSHVQWATASSEDKEIGRH